jgi:hypothetical protein
VVKADPDLFREIIDRFEGIAVPPEDGVITYLNRQGFNPSAVRPAARAFLQTMAYVEELRGSESHGNQSPCPSESTPPVVEGGNAKAYGGAKVGDLIQWESQGSLQFPTPRRVRFVTEDGLWVAVEGSETGIPMNEVMVENRAGAIAPNMPHIPKEAEKKAESEAGFEEWFRAKVGAGKQIQILYRGGEDIGPKEVQKLIDILAAQKIALEE